MRNPKWGRLLTVFLAFWICCLLYFVFGGGGLIRSSSTEMDNLKDDLKIAGSELRKLETENIQLRALVQELREDKEKSGRLDGDGDAGQDDSDNNNNIALSPPLRLLDGPNFEYEKMRRTLKRDIKEMWWYIRANLESVIDSDELKDQELKTHLKTTLEDTLHREKIVLSDLKILTENDGYTNWRKREAKDLSDLVQARIRSLQNPEDCDEARTLICNLNKGCGYGCQIHHAVYCFIVAYGTQRTLVLKSKGWRYNKAGFEDVFLPLSDTCPHYQIPADKAHWPGKEDTKAVEIGIVDSVNPRPIFLPPSIPRDLADRIIRIHGDPVVWWIGQFLKYMLRPQEELNKLLTNSAKAHGIEDPRTTPGRQPIVGIHVRRTDKVGTEAAYHSVEEYMRYVDEYFKGLEARGNRTIAVKRVYVASDDPKVLAECRKKFSGYEFLGDQSVAKSAAVSSRYTSGSLKGIITDIHLLSITDHLVCTFSSQVCRIAYELMQDWNLDAYDKFKSLDDIWYFGGQSEHQQMAVMAHEARSRQEIDIKPGDVLGVAGNHWNGYNKGRNHRTNKVGLYPEYKTVENWKIVDFPAYEHVKRP